MPPVATGPEHARRRSTFLVEAIQELLRPGLDVPEVARRAARLAVPAVAEHCVVTIAPRSGGAGLTVEEGRRPDAGTVIRLPLAAGDEQVGEITLAASSDRDGGVLAELAGDLVRATALGLESARTHAVVHDELRVARAARTRSAALQRLAEQLSRAATPEAIGALGVEQASEMIGADAATLFVPGPELPDGPSLTMVYSAGWPDETTGRYRSLPLHRGRPLSDAVLDGTPVWLEDAAQWRARYPEMAPVGTSSGYEASACLPLRAEDRRLGGLVFSFLQPRRFDEIEREYLLAVAALCAQALDRARLYVAERAARKSAEVERDRVGFLARLGLLLDAPLSVEARMQQLADLVVPGVADWCAIHLTHDDRVEQVAVAHSDPDKVGFVRDLQRRYPPNPGSPGGAMEVARTGVPVFTPEITDEMLGQVATDPTHLELIRSIGLRSFIIVPLAARGLPLGAISLATAESGRRFDAADVSLAEQIGRRAGLALHNARLYQQQRQIADALQSALLPAELPSVPGVQLAARYLAQAEGADVGGDVYDVFADDTDGSWSVVLADVCGKGPTAAALTALIRHTLRAEAGHGLTPADALRRLNRAILRQADLVEAQFATVVHGKLRVDERGATLTLVSAGHLPPLVLRGETVEEYTVAGTLLGVFPDPELRETEIRMGPGDIVLLYTDGVTEARSGSGFYGVGRVSARLLEHAADPAERIAEALATDVVDFQGGRLRDDVALLVFRVPGTPEANP
jgi:serine phosphatase RsbU (regulator of sigma subunit)